VLKFLKVIGGLALGMALAAQSSQPAHLQQGRANPVVATVAEDPELAKAIAPLAEHIHAQFGQLLVDCPAGLNRTAGPGEFPLGFLVADLMRASASRTLGTEVAFAVTNAGGIRRNLGAGPVRVQDIYEALPFENELVVAEFTGAEVIALVREAIQGRGGEPCSGIRATVTGPVSQPRLTVTWSDGRAIDPAAMVRVATTDYLLASAEPHSALKRARHPVTTGLAIRQVVIDALAALGRAGRPLSAPDGSRYRYSPDIKEAIQARAFHFQETQWNGAASSRP
jgi:2',3'-cyclic-nucleotide 2'-phosphodiesterase (5'-nucleotidase family)